jgi:hypothetical protein
VRKTIPCLLLVISCVLFGTTWAQEMVPSLQPGSAERKAILRALRVPVRKELKKQALFKVDHLKVQDQWAFMRGVLQQPQGKPMNYTGTPYQGAIKLGVFDDWICALLYKERGKWRVVTYVIGATDVAYDGWDKQYQAPASIFK